MFGNRRQKGFPKMGQLLQTLVYLNDFEDRLPYFRMVYFGRDSVKRKTFKIELHHEGDTKYPKVDGEVVRSFSVNDILARYKLLQSHVDSNVAPPRDFELVYPDEKVRDFFSKGKVAKTKFEAWSKGKLKGHEKIGDWQCGYCQFKNVCWDK
jgi:MoaA/NifB/PqqE/SkfB family radical SAM enzyme